MRSCVVALVAVGLSTPALWAQAPAPAALPAVNATAVPGETIPESLRFFDPESVRLVWSERRWQLRLGESVLKDFGRRESEGRLALRLIQSLHLNQQGTIGRPNPVMEYWLSDGQAPQGLTPDIHVLTLDPASLHVEQIQGQWCLRDDLHVLFNFGLRSRDAQLALQVVRRYGFTHVGAIGQGTPAMLIFLCNPNDAELCRHHAATRTARPLQAAGNATPGVRSPGQKVMLHSAAAGIGEIVTPALPPLRRPAHGPRSEFVQTAGSAVPRQFWHQQKRFLEATPLVPGLDDEAERVPFDWRRVRLHQINGSWALVAGEQTLAIIGPSDEDARLALNAVLYYHFTELCRIGKPSLCSYFLVNGHAPRGLLAGVPIQPFQPDTLRVQAIGGRWGLFAGNQLLLSCDHRPEEARQLLEAIRQNGFDGLCRIGPTGASGMTFFVRSR